jgi:tripartite-type tricarboxylate transporter receptor subunit TctC
MVIANPGVPAKTLAELVALSKTLLNGLDYGIPGIGSTQQLMFELIKLRTGRISPTFPTVVLHQPSSTSSPVVYRWWGRR